MTMQSRRLTLIEGAKNSDLSVTSVDETQRGHKSPAKCYKLLRPWIELANWAPKLWALKPQPAPAPIELIRWIEQERETPSFPRGRLRSVVESGQINRGAVLSEYF